MERVKRAAQQRTGTFRRRALLAYSSLGAAALAAACGGGKSKSDGGSGGSGSGVVQTGGAAVVSAKEAKRGGVLRVSQPGDINPKDMPHTIAPANYLLQHGIYERLAAYDLDLKPQPVLATSWEFSPDFTALTFKLGDAAFHSGRPFTSEDVRQNIDRIATEKVTSQLTNRAKQVASVETPDPRTVTLKLSFPNPSIMDMIHLLYIAEPASFATTPTGKGVSGTGPFRMKEWTPNDHISLERFAQYRTQPQPYLDGMEVRILPDANSASINLETNTNQWIFGVEPQDAARLAKNKDLNVIDTHTEARTWYLGCDLKHPPLADKRVRQALAVAIDRDRIVQRVLYGYGRATAEFWPKKSPAFDPAKDSAFKLDQQKAKQLLAAAGWDPATELTLSWSDQYPPTGPMSELIQSDLAQVGVKTRIEKLENAVATDKLTKAQYRGLWLTLIGFVHMSPASLFVQSFPARIPNSSNFESPRYKELIDLTLKETDPQKLKANYAEFTSLLQDEAFIIPISPVETLWALRTSVQGLTWDLSDYVPAGKLWLDS